MTVDFKALAAKAAQTEDQTQDAATFTFEIPEEGATVARFIEYIELGNQPQREYKGQSRPDAFEVILTFELLHPTKNMKEIDGKKVGQPFRLPRMTKKLNDKAGFRKLFKKMVYGRPDIKHMAQMLNEAFVLNIHHNTVTGTDGKERTYAGIKNDGEFLVSAPFQVDALTGDKTPYNVPEATRPIRIFLFDNPTKETWDSLYVEGTREDKDGNTISKNWLQETIMTASNFTGSAVEAMIGGVADLPATEEEVEADLPVEEAPAEKPAKKKKEQKKKDAPKVDEESKPVEQTSDADTAVSDAEDALAALGLDM